MEKEKQVRTMKAAGHKVDLEKDPRVEPPQTMKDDAEHEQKGRKVIMTDAQTVGLP